MSQAPEIVLLEGWMLGFEALPEDSVILAEADKGMISRVGQLSLRLCPLCANAVFAGVDYVKACVPRAFGRLYCSCLRLGQASSFRSGRQPFRPEQGRSNRDL